MQKLKLCINIFCLVVLLSAGLFPYLETPTNSPTVAKPSSDGLHLPMVTAFSLSESISIPTLTTGACVTGFIRSSLTLVQDQDHINLNQPATCISVKPGLASVQTYLAVAPTQLEVSHISMATSLPSINAPSVELPSGTPRTWGITRSTSVDAEVRLVAWLVPVVGVHISVVGQPHFISTKTITELQVFNC